MFSITKDNHYCMIINRLIIFNMNISDKECPLYSQAMSVVLANNNEAEEPQPAPDALKLVQQMRDDGLALKK